MRSDSSQPQSSSPAELARPRTIRAVPTNTRDGFPTDPASRDLLGTPPGDWSSVDQVVRYANAVEQVEPSHTLAIPARELVDLYRKLESQPVIEQAKGIVMGYYGLDGDTAFTVLRRWSQDGNVKLRSLAEALVAGVHHEPASAAVAPEDLARRVMTTHPAQCEQGRPGFRGLV